MVLFSIAAASVFAQYNSNIYIEGTAENARQMAFFAESFRAEARALGYSTTDNKSNAGYTLKFTVRLNIITGADGTRRLAPPGEKQYTILISCVRNIDNRELASLDYFFTSLEEMYGVTQRLFFMAAGNIPIQNTPAESPPIEDKAVTPAPESVIALESKKTPRWQSQWLYLRGSLNYMITFFPLKPDGLYMGHSLYDGDDIGNPDRYTVLDNKITAFPGATLGLEFQFLPWMSLEAMFLANFGDPYENTSVNLTAGAEIKFPGKIGNFLLEPYAAFLHPIFFNKETYSNSPGFALGGGIQVGLKAGRKGAVFLDAKFMYYLGDAVLKNPFADTQPPYYQNPKDIHYRHFAFAVGAGYKQGFFDRKRR